LDEKHRNEICSISTLIQPAIGNGMLPHPEAHPVPGE
jgi:hypothetical protein